MCNIVILKSFHSYSHYIQSIVQTFTNATRLWVSADIVHSSPTNMGHKQYTNLGHHSQFKVMQTKGKETPQLKITNMLKHLLNMGYTKLHKHLIW